jgi:hypothetical protein
MGGAVRRNTAFPTPVAFLEDSSSCLLPVLHSSGGAPSIAGVLNLPLQSHCWIACHELERGFRACRSVCLGFSLHASLSSFK